MAYLQHTSWKDRPGAVAGVIAVHALIGYALITGLSFESIIDPPTRLESKFIEDIPLDPPPPRAVEEKREVTPPNPVVAPLPPLVLSPRVPVMDTIPTPMPIPATPYLAPLPVPTAEPAVRKPAFDPVGARPRNDPSAWVTTADYRSSWINREMTGTARFRLEIAASGQVETCTITASSGHADLDRATCDLVRRRARFEPARNGEGEKAAGSFSSAVRWELPR